MMIPGPLDWVKGENVPEMGVSLGINLRSRMKKTNMNTDYWLSTHSWGIPWVVQGSCGRGQLEWTRCNKILPAPPHSQPHTHTHTYTRGRRTPMVAYIDLHESYKVKVICNYIVDTFLIG